MKLTQQQIDDFNREGWLFLPELFSQEEVKLLAREAERIYDTDRPEVWREKSGAPRTAFAAHLYNEAFGLLGAHPRMIDPVEQIFAGNAKAAEAAALAHAQTAGRMTEERLRATDKAA